MIGSQPRIIDKTSRTAISSGNLFRLHHTRSSQTTNACSPLSCPLTHSASMNVTRRVEQFSTVAAMHSPTTSRVQQQMSECRVIMS
eukprot:950558-Amphidinium_carterae.1